MPRGGPWRRRLRVRQGSQRERFLRARPGGRARYRGSRAGAAYPRRACAPMQRQPDRALDPALPARRTAFRVRPRAGPEATLSASAYRPSRTRHSARRAFVSLTSGRVDFGERCGGFIQQLVGLAKRPSRAASRPRFLVPRSRRSGRAPARLTRTMSGRAGSASTSRPWSDSTSARLFSCTGGPERVSGPEFCLPAGAIAPSTASSQRPCAVVVDAEIAERGAANARVGHALR